MQTKSKEQSFKSTKQSLRDTWTLLDRKRKVKFLFVLSLMLLSGAAELVSLGAIVPLLAFLSDNNQLKQFPYFGAILSYFGIKSRISTTVFLCAVFALVAVLSGLVRLINLWLSGRFAAEVGSLLSCEAYRNTLLQPYSFHLYLDSSRIISSTQNQVNRCVAALFGVMQLITSVIVSIFIVAALVAINAFIALAAMSIFSFCYLLLYQFTKRVLSSNGRLIAQYSHMQVKALRDGLGAIKNIILSGRYHEFISSYYLADVPQRQLEQSNRFISQYPRYILEVISLVFVSVLACYAVIFYPNKDQIIPILGAFALGAQKLLPSLQLAYSSSATIKACTPDLSDILELANQKVEDINNCAVDPYQLQSSIEFRRVSFSYNSKTAYTLSGISFNILKGEVLGLVGETGSGKSSLIDLIMGLLPPADGNILIDGVNLYDSDSLGFVSSWRRSVAHVPQRVYLSNASISDNIALGLPPGRAVRAEVELAAKKAEIHSYILSTSSGYDTNVGEGGIKMSGGQLQRIGIARALYGNCSLLVLDEATSSLDSETEEKIIKNIHSLDPSVTIIMVAHRLASLKGCDRIFKLKSSGLFIYGSYAEFMHDKDGRG